MSQRERDRTPALAGHRALSKPFQAQSGKCRLLYVMYIHLFMFIDISVYGM